MNPHGGEAARFSKPARRAVSGYLPYSVQWTGRGIEPRSPRCKRGIFPLDEPPMFSDPGWNRTITFLHVTQVSSPLDHGIKLSVTEVGVEPTGTRLSTSSLCQFAYPVVCQ